jgi:hypothetical protein
MRLLDWLLGKRGPAFVERIWPTTVRKIDDLVAQVRQCQALGLYPVAVAHFRATQQRLLDSFDKRGIAVHLISSPAQFPVHPPEEWDPRETVLLLSSETIPPAFQRALRARREGAHLAPVSVHLAEHYPCPGRDQDVLTLETIWSRPIKFTCYTGLDEPWLALLGIERVRELIVKLGMDEATVLSHPTLHRAIRSAQQRLAQRVRHDQRCDSCEEWVQCNLPRLSA